MREMRNIPATSTESLYHVFIDFKKAFDRVCTKPYGQPWGASIKRAIENLYDKAQRAVL